jgi:hypothetical protein
MSPGEHIKVERLDEERKGLLRRIVECQAYRQRMSGNIRGHGMKFVLNLDSKLHLVRDLEHEVSVLREVERIYQKIGGSDLVEVVRAKMERIPYPATKLELAICLALTDRAERIAAESYTGSVAAEFAAIAKTLVDRNRDATQRGEQLFLEFCSDESNRPHAQQMFDRWLAIALRSLGRPGTTRDARAVELGLRTRLVADSVKEYLVEVVDLAKRCGLELPTGESIAIELPVGAPAGTTG